MVDYFGCRWQIPLEPINPVGINFIVSDGVVMFEIWEIGLKIEMLKILSLDEEPSKFLLLSICEIEVSHHFFENETFLMHIVINILSARFHDSRRPSEFVIIDFLLNISSISRKPAA